MVINPRKVAGEFKMENYLAQAFVETISEMAFIDAIQDDVKSVMEEQIGYKLTILRPFSDHIYVFFPKKVVSQMIENMFAGEENIHSPEICFDCVAEFLNVLAGKYFQLAKPDQLFELSLPTQAELEDVPREFIPLAFKTAEGHNIMVYHKL